MTIGPLEVIHACIHLILAISIRFLISRIFYRFLAINFLVLDVQFKLVGMYGSWGSTESGLICVFVNFWCKGRIVGVQRHWLCVYVCVLFLECVVLSYCIPLAGICRYVLARLHDYVGLCDTSMTSITYIVYLYHSVVISLVYLSVYDYNGGCLASSFWRSSYPKLTFTLFFLYSIMGEYGRHFLSGLLCTYIKG